MRRAPWIAVRFLALACFAPLATASEPHVVEELTFQVAAEAREQFLKHDAAIWTPTLSAQPGYLGKETWLSSHPRDEIKLVIRWRSRKDWNAVPKPLLAATDARFKAAMGDADWRMRSGRAFRTVAPPTAEAGLSVNALLNRESLLSAVEVRVSWDPTCFAAKRYLAVPLRGAIERLASEDTDTGSLQVVFDCTDNYHSRMPLADFLAGDPWLAFRDLDAPDGEAWSKSQKGPTPEKMGLAYAIWRNAKKPRELTWPYAVERIRLAPAD